MDELQGVVPMKDAGAAKESTVLSQGERKGFFSRIWKLIFRVRNEDYEKKLQYLTKEEATVHAKMKRRAQSSRKLVKNFIMISMTLEVLAVAIAVIAIRSLEFTGSIKLFRTLPAVLIPGFSYVVYSLLESLTRMLDRKDRITLEKLRAERKAKIDEFKERTNYYNTQQFIQRYDIDPAAKLAAATALASRLGAESGLKVHVGDESSKSAENTKNTGDQEQSNVLRHRKKPSPRGVPTQLPESPNDVGLNPRGHTSEAPDLVVVDHYRGSDTSDGSWVARIAALLVGEDPSQLYALICGNCRRHNGLSRKEDFPHMTYYCPHCHALNGSNQVGDQDSAFGTALNITDATGGGIVNLSGSSGGSVTSVETMNYVPERVEGLHESTSD